MTTSKNTATEWKALAKSLPSAAQIKEMVAQLRDENDFGLRYKPMLADWLEAFAASSPERVIELLEQVERLTRERDEARERLRQMVDAIENGQIDSPELDGDPANGIPPHKWHEEWVHYARAALSESQNP